MTTVVHVWETPFFCVATSAKHDLPSTWDHARARLKPIPCRFPLQASSKFFSHLSGRNTAGPHMTGTGWRQIHGSTYERLQQQVLTEMKNPERRSRSGVCSIPIPAFQKGFLTLRKSSCIKRMHLPCSLEDEVWSRSVEGSGHQGLCSQLFHRLWRDQQTLKTIWDVTRKWDNDAF